MILYEFQNNTLLKYHLYLKLKIIGVPLEKFKEHTLLMCNVLKIVCK